MLFWLKYTLNTNGELIALSYMIDKICSLIYALRGHLKCSYIFQYFFSLTYTHIYSVWNVIYQLLFIFIFVKQFMHQTHLQLKNKDRTRTLVHIYIFIDTIWLKYIPNGNRPLYCSQTSLQSSTSSSKHHCKR